MNKALLRDLGIFFSGVTVGIITATLYLDRGEDEWFESDDEEVPDKVEPLEFASDPSAFPSLQKDEELKRDYAASYQTSDPREEFERERNEHMEKLLKESEQEHPQDDKPIEPYIITAEEFVEDVSYEKCPLAFYEDDEMLVDENEELADIDFTIGQENYKILVTEDWGDALYVRNPRISTDYEIYTVLGSYKDAILGGVE